MSVLASDTYVASLGDEIGRQWGGDEGGAGAGKNPPSSPSTSGGRRQRKTFRALSAEVVHQISVLQRLKLLARAKKQRLEEEGGGPPPLSQSVDVRRGCDDDDEDRALPPLGRAESCPTARLAPAPGDAPASSSSPPASPSAQQPQQQQLPRWFQSLSRKQSQKQSLDRQLASQCSLRSVGSRGLCLKRSSPAICGCSAEERAETAEITDSPSSKKTKLRQNTNKTVVMCKRHSLRALWRRFFLSFPRECTNLKQRQGQSPGSGSEDVLGALLCEDVALFQPCGGATGKAAAMEVFARYNEMECQAELVHCFVDEAADVTFSEFVLTPCKQPHKHIRICEVVQWDLRHYRDNSESDWMDVGGDGGGRNAYDKARVLQGKLPAVKKIMYFGKGMSLWPNDDLPAPFRVASPAASADAEKESPHFSADFSGMVSRYLEALMANDYDRIYGMLCANFRVNAFDGVRTRDTFVSWLKSLVTTQTFRREIQNVFVDHGSKAAFLYFHAKCDKSSAILVNVVQWDLDGKRISQIREFGAGFSTRL